MITNEIDSIIDLACTRVRKMYPDEIQILVWANPYTEDFTYMFFVKIKDVEEAFCT